METKRVVRLHEANKVEVDNTVVREYYSQVVADLGLSTATMEGTYPPKDEGYWAINERVEEMLYVLAGSARVVYQDGESIELVPESAAYLPRGLKYRIEDARGLRVVVSTGPAWSVEQHKWSAK